MKVAQVQFVPWDKTYFFSLNDFEVEKGARVIVKTELGTELGEVISFSDVDEKKYVFLEDGETETSTESETTKKVLKPILRIANEYDLEKVPNWEEKKTALEYCKKVKEKFELPMKIVDVHFSFDGSRITFAFIADGRVDFRELVKELTRHFSKTIRLQQIGIRDEAKIRGDYGHCGRQLCCRRHLNDLESITSEMADLQQCAHRGSERISGICGRLMCCLAYEQKGYEDMSKKMPPIDAKVNVDGQRGRVVCHHLLKQSVDVEFSGENGNDKRVTEVDLNRKKKKQ